MFRKMISISIYLLVVVFCICCSALETYPQEDTLTKSIDNMTEEWDILMGEESSLQHLVNLTRLVEEQATENECCDAGDDSAILRLIWSEVRKDREITKVLQSRTPELLRQMVSPMLTGLQKLQQSVQAFSARLAYVGDRLVNMTSTLQQMRSRIAEVADSIKRNDLSDAEGECPEPFQEVGNECLYLHNEVANWTSAEENCHFFGGELAVPEDKALYTLGGAYRSIHSPHAPLLDVLKDARRSLGVKHIDVWLGATDGDGDGVMTWMSGEEVSLTEGYKENITSQCLAIFLWMTGDYGTEAQDCSSTNYFLCKRNETETSNEP